MPDPERPGPAAPTPPHVPRGRVLFRAPSPPVELGFIALLSAALAWLYWPGLGTAYGVGFLVGFLVPALVAGALTTPLVGALGGRLELHRSLFLTLSTLLLQLPLAAAWRAGEFAFPAIAPPLTFLGPFLAAPVFWFRHLTLYGVARPSHSRMLPASLLHPALFLLGLGFVVPYTLGSVAELGAVLVFAFVCALVVLRASDRPIRREFHASGVSLIRPLLDHVGGRDREATRALEEFFVPASVLADVQASLLAFVHEGRVRATVALPSVHPGPFAALGSSDLPRKLSAALGTRAGTVLVPHTPSDHDLDLAASEEVDRLASVSKQLLDRLPPPRVARSSPLVSPYPGSFARAQILGDVALVLLSQAPEPTDDIAYSVADRLIRDLDAGGDLAIALVDAHNSYVEERGDISYGSPAAKKLLEDARAAVAAARAAVQMGPIEVGVAVRDGYSIGRDGIGPEGIRALVVRAAGSTVGYVLIDGNNLVVGARATILDALRSVVDVAEVLTTDNHVVHEVDGGVNPVGERTPAEALARDAKEVLTRARDSLGPAEPRFGTQTLTGVRVLGPGYTARLLTSLGDTVSMFARMFPASLVLLLTSSLVVALLLR